MVAAYDISRGALTTTSVIVEVLVTVMMRMENCLVLNEMQLVR